MVSFRYLVNDVSKSIEFYSGALGFELIQQYGPAMAILTNGEFTLWLAGPPSSAAQVLPDGRKPIAGGWNRIVLEVKNLNETVTTLKAKGIAFRHEVNKSPAGFQALCDDPSGNPIELFQAI